MLRNKNFFLGSALLFILALAVLLQFQLMLSWDNSWLLLMTKRWLAGGTYTKDFFDTDPPMILYVYSLPVLLAKVANLVLIFKAYVFCIGFVSLFLAYQLLMSIFKKDSYLRYLWLLSLALIFWIVPTFEFGQRDCLIVMLLTPYLLSVLARMSGDKSITPGMPLMLGVLAAVGIGIKPYFLIIVLLSEIYLVIYTRRLLNCLRIDTVTMALTLIGYLVSVYWLFPDYISTVLPFAWRLYPGGMGEPLFKMIFSYGSVFCFTVMVFSWFMPAIEGDKNISNYLTVILLGFTALFIYQRNFFYYHFLPAFSYALLLIIFNSTLLLTKSSPSQRYLMAKIAGSVLFTIFIIVFARPIWTLLYFQPWVFYSFFAGIFFTILCCERHDAVVRNVVIALVLTGIGALVSKFCHFMDWYSQPFLFNVAALILLFALFAPGETKARHFEHAWQAFLVAVAFAYPVYYVFSTADAGYRNDKHIRQSIESQYKKYKLFGPISVFTTQMSSTFPALDYAGAEYASRFPFFWMLPTLVAAQASNAQTQQDITFTIDAVAADLTNRKPAYVFIDAKPKKAYLKTPFDYLDFFKQNKNFQAAWTNYRYAGTFTIPCELFENQNDVNFIIYQRITP